MFKNHVTRLSSIDPNKETMYKEPLTNARMHQTFVFLDVCKTKTLTPHLLLLTNLFRKYKLS